MSTTERKYTAHQPSHTGVGRHPYGLYHGDFEHDSCGVGFIAHIKGDASNRILTLSQEMLERMTHRTAMSADNESGDGSGVMVALCHDFFTNKLRNQDINSLPHAGEYALGNIFMPVDEKQYDGCLQAMKRIASECALEFRDIFDLELNENFVGEVARRSQPAIRQLLVANTGYTAREFRLLLYVLTKRIAHEVRGSDCDPERQLYICSLTPDIIVYKGMLTPHQLFRFYCDLQNADHNTHFAMVHSRFSTNTFPSWDRAQPNRCMSHNGEINTLRGNINKMFSRQGALQSADNPLFSKLNINIHDLMPIVESDTSDSGSFDNVLEFMLYGGYSVPHAVLKMIPEAWEHNDALPEEIRAMYEYSSCKIEPWDGPATISFCDGSYIGAVLDRNGLRPSRYYVTSDDLVILASEVGVAPIDPASVRVKGRLKPGRMFLIDFENSTIVDDDALKKRLSHQFPYAKWVQDNRIALSDHVAHYKNITSTPSLASDKILNLFGYTVEHINFLIKPMTKTAKEPTGSMGNDAPLAILSKRPKLLYDYFHQLFAQVTNPPIDSIRERLIMSLHSYIGPQESLLRNSEKSCRRILLRSPLLLDSEFSALQDIATNTFALQQYTIFYEYSERKSQLKNELLKLCKDVETAIDNGINIIVLTDRGIEKKHIPISPLLAVGAVHQHLIKYEKRTRVALIVDSAEPREVHHFCALLGYGADAIHPYLVLALIARIKHEEKEGVDHSLAQLIHNYREGVHYGLRKVLGKMGISTLESYKGAQIFEILGLNSDVIDVCFRGTVSRIGGASFNILEQEAAMRYNTTYTPNPLPFQMDIPNTGEYQWRAHGEYHQWNPNSIAYLQMATQKNDASLYNKFVRSLTTDEYRGTTIRGHLNINYTRTSPIPIDLVEPADDIMRRFVTGAMSFGSISQEAHETLAVAMNRIGGRSNTGEGGEQAERYIPLPNGDSLRSAIKQIASGRFGVSIEYLSNADEIQIKMAQGAKPGEGGELPGHKVFEVIARTRNSTPGVGLISPPPHHDIYSIEDLSQLIYDLKNSNPHARISVKLVSEVGVGTIAAGVVKGLANHILISGYSGGTGASPLTSIKHAGLPWELGIAETHQTLCLNDLRDRVVLQADGQLKCGHDVVVAAMLGAEEFGFSTAPLIAMGCIMMRVCHLNTCPVGIATQDERLRKNFKGRPEHVIRYFRFVAEQVRHTMSRLGMKKFDELIGRSDLLSVDNTILHWKSESISFDALLMPVEHVTDSSHKEKLVASNRLEVNNTIDAKIIATLKKDFKPGQSIRISHNIGNTDRTVGTLISNYLTSGYRSGHIADDSLILDLHGSAGQSFGSWLTSGVTLKLEGDANDYVGKGLSGGKIIVYPPKQSIFNPEDTIIIGNVALYGALSGYCFVNGQAAERFCVRNSGAHAVVEGVGDHGCEYMTGGRVLILGSIGRNFAAGMSGGIAYIWDKDGSAPQHINTSIVDIEVLEDEDVRAILELLRDHHRHTLSPLAERLLECFEDINNQFIRVISPAYRQTIEMQRERELVSEQEIYHG